MTIVGCSAQQLAGGALASSRGQQAGALQVDIGGDFRRRDERKRFLEHGGGRAEPPGVGGRARRRQQPGGAALAVGRETRRPRKRHGLDGHAAAAPRPQGCLFETERHVLVGRRGGRRAVPRPPVGVALLRERPGERVVGRAPVVRRRVVVHRRPQQRIAELDRALTDRDDARLLGSGQARGVGADRRDGIVDGRHRGLVTGCGYEQRPSRLGREREDAALVDAAHARGSRQRADDRLAPRKLRGCQAVRQRRKRQGVAARVAPELFDHILGLDGACQQLPHLVELEPAESQLLEAAVVERARPVRPFRGNQSDPADVEASCDEPERVPRPGIEVVRIVDQQQDRLLVCRRHQQAQCACEHLEATAGLGVAEPESAAQSARLHRRDHVQPGEHGREQLVQPRERQIRLCGHASCREHEPAVCICGDLLEQVALADPRLAAHDECPTAAAASFREQLSDAATLGDPSDEHGTAILCTRWGGHKPTLPGILV